MARLAGDAFRPLGSLRLAADGEEREDLRDEIEALWADGIEAEWIDVPDGLLAGRFTAAIRHPTDGALQPARCVRALAARAADAGVELVEGRRVSDPSELEAETVVVATDGYPSGLLGELEGLIVPTRGQVIATEPLSERLFEAPHYGRHGFDYWHQAEDGRIVAGGFRDVSLDREFTDEEALTDDVQDALSSFVNGLVGRELRVDYRWAGIFGLVLDFLPVVGRGTGPAGNLGRRRLLGTRERARASPAAAWSPARSSATAIRCSTCSSLRAAARRLSRAQSSTRGRSSWSAFANAARAIARSWIARPVESNSVTSSALRRPSASPASTAPSSVTPSRVTTPAATAAASSPPWLACSQSSQNRCARPSSSTATSALPGPSAPISETCWPGRSEPGG